jgi:hypothetical protein
MHCWCHALEPVTRSMCTSRGCQLSMGSENLLAWVSLPAASIGDLTVSFHRCYDLWPTLFQAGPAAQDTGHFQPEEALWMQSKASQRGAPVVAFQGVYGAYSEAAALDAVPGSQPLPCEHFETAFQVHMALHLFSIDSGPCSLHSHHKHVKPICSALYAYRLSTPCPCVALVSVLESAHFSCQNGQCDHAGAAGLRLRV